MNPSILTTFVPSCAPLVDAAIARALVAVERSAELRVIGFVGALDRRPRHPDEAVATAHDLQA